MSGNEIAPIRSGEEFDTEAVRAFLLPHAGELELSEPPGSVAAMQFPGGHANLTYWIRFGGREFVLRRPPLGPVGPGAHDMGREWACIAALWGRGVPVAQPLAFCESPDVTGAHFYVMGLVDGRAMYSRADVEDWIPEANRVKAAESWIDGLAALHSLDIDEIGLGDLGRREDYVLRQMKTWYRSWTSSAEAAEIDDQLLERASHHQFVNPRSGHVAVLTTNAFDDAMPAALTAGGASVTAVERMTLEEIFLATSRLETPPRSPAGRCAAGVAHNQRGVA